MRIFYDLRNGEVVQSAKSSFKDITNLFGKLLPNVTVLKDTKQVAMDEGVLGNNLLETYYLARGYSVWRR